MNKSIIPIMIVIAIALGLGYYVWQRAKSMVNESIKIGVLAPLSGGAAVLGERMRNGAELAKEDILKLRKDISIEIIYEDACQPAQAVSAVRKLLDVNQVSFIGGSLCLIGLDAITPITEERRVIVFNTAANPDVELDKKYVFSTNFAVRDDAKKLATYAYEIMGARTAAIIHFETSFGNDYDKYLTQYFEEYGGEIVFSEGKLLDVSDWRTDLVKIQALKPDVIFTIHWANSLGNFLRQAKELGLTSKMLGYYEDEDPTVIEYAGSAAENFVISSSESEKETKQISDFKIRYKMRYGSDPDVLASNIYDAINLGITAYLKCNGDADCMAGELYKVKNYR